MPKILVADDSRLARIQTSAILRKAGYEVIEAKNGKEAVDLCESAAPDFLVLDILMPIMEGQEVVMYLHEHDIKVPFVILSADIQVATRESFINNGALQVLRKPAREAELLEVIGRALGKRV
jgi:CheY-like chemotaxis protein